MKEIRIVSEEDNDWYIDTEIRDLNGRNVIITNADGFCNCDIIIWDNILTWSQLDEFKKAVELAEKLWRNKNA